MKFAKRLLTTLTLASLLAACGGQESADGVNPYGGEGRQTLRADIEREAIADLPAEVAEIKRGNIDLSVELLRQATKPEKNQMISAYSIRTAFGQVYGGAKGETAQEMNEVLRLGLEGDAFHSAMNAVDQALASRAMPAGDELEAVQLHTANSVWGRPDLPWMESYLELLARHYGAAVEAIDFAADPEAARSVINAWVEDKTEDRIKDLLPRGAIKPTTPAVLTNAVYFKAPWADKFEAEATRDLPFMTLDGTTIEVPTMTQGTYGGHAEGEGWFAVEKPFRGHALSMLFIVPDAGTFADFEAGLDAAKMEEIVDGLSGKELALRLPKFDFETTALLKKPLQDMGLSQLFSNAADLSGMIEGGQVKVSEAYHKTFVAIDEGGAEAAAATAIVLAPTTSLPPPRIDAIVDRPFVFAIRDVETGLFLFYGRVVDPS